MSSKTVTRALFALLALAATALLGSAQERQPALPGAAAPGDTPHGLALIVVPGAADVASGSAMPAAQFQLANQSSVEQELRTLTLHLSNPSLFDAIVLTREGMAPIRIDHPASTAVFALPAALELEPGSSASFKLMVRMGTPALVALRERWEQLNLNWEAGLAEPKHFAEPAAYALIGGLLLYALTLLPHRWQRGVAAGAFLMAGHHGVAASFAEPASDIALAAVVLTTHAGTGVNHSGFPARLSTITRL